MRQFVALALLAPTLALADSPSIPEHALQLDGERTCGADDDDCEVELLQTRTNPGKSAGKEPHPPGVDRSAMGPAKIDPSMLQVQQDANEAFEEEDAVGDMEAFGSFSIYKPTVDVPKPMPVLVGTYNTDWIIDSVDGLGHAAVIWNGRLNKVGKMQIGECKWNNPLVQLFGRVLDAIYADPDFDTTRIVATGFSASGKAATLFLCYAHKLMGIYISGAGPSVTSNPGCGLSLEGACNSVVIKENDNKPYPGQCEDCFEAVLKNCEVDRNCTTLAEYPCFIWSKFVVVAQTGRNDYQKYTSDLLYEAAKAEGMDARRQIWKMGHNRPKELSAVIMGTFGLGKFCPWECHKAVEKCTGSARWKNLNWCLAWPTRHRPKECPKFCVPTLKMLNFSEDAWVTHEGNYGHARKIVTSRPAKSKCYYWSEMRR